MKIKKRIIIMADILVDEDFDTDYLCICEDVGNIDSDSPFAFVGESENFEILDYISQEAIELKDEELCSECGETTIQGSGRFINRIVHLDGGFTCAKCDEKLRMNPLDTIKENAEEMENKENENS